MSRRRARPGRTLVKASAAGVPAMARGSTYTADQVLGLLQQVANQPYGGQQAVPLPRLEPPVPFGPGVPLDPAPINPIDPRTGRAAPRQYEFPVTFNLPGFGDRLLPWKVLRDAADAIPLFRRCIEIRKDEVTTLDWDVTISSKAVERAQRQDPGSARSDIEKTMRKRVEPHIGRLVAFWEEPDRHNGLDFIAWASKLLEEYFVLDAVAIYPRPTLGGDVFALEILDGTTIKPLLDTYGFRPLPPNPAYQQVLYGFPRGEFVADGDMDPDTGAVSGGYDTDTLIYAVHNVRSFTPYGYSAVEQALVDGDLYAQRHMWLKSEYTDGVMPAGWLLAGQGQADWSADQLKAYERQFNDYLMGNTPARQRYRILPYGMTPDPSKTDLGEKYRPDYDLHLIKLVASHFGTTIAELGFTETGGLGSTGWHEGQADVQDRKATQPTLRRLQSLCTRIMRRHLGAPPELEFRILGLESEDEDAADEVAERRVAGARMTLNEDRDRTGLPRYSFPEADMPMLITQRGIVFVDGASKLAEAGQMIGPAQAVPVGQPAATDPNAPPGTPAPTAAEKAELTQYRRWLAKRDGRTPGRRFAFEHLSEDDAVALGVDLELADFVGKADGGDPGTAPKVRHWPGWDRDLAVAEHWAPVLHRALTGAPSGLLSLASSYLAMGLAPGQDVALSWLETRHLPIAEALRPALVGLWTDGYYVGSVSSRAVLAHHGLIVKAQAAPEQFLTMGVDWGAWSPGDEVAARELLGIEGMGEGLAALLERAGIVLKGIEATKLNQLAAILADGLEKGLGAEKVASNLRGLLDDMKWAYKVALTETTRAQSSATLYRYARNGVSAKDWMTAADQHVCVTCNTNEDMGAVPIDQTFPSGDDAPPGHPLCRCSLAPAWLTADEAAAAGLFDAIDLRAEVEASIAAIDRLSPLADVVAEWYDTLARLLAPSEDLVLSSDAVEILASRLLEAADDAAAALGELGEAAGADLVAFARAAEARDVAGMHLAVRDIMDRAGLRYLDNPYDIVGFDPRTMIAVGDVAAGDAVYVVTPGVVGVVDGEQVELVRSVVMPLTADVQPAVEANLARLRGAMEGMFGPADLPGVAGAEVDPALKLTVKELRQIAADNGVPRNLLGTRKADIVQTLRDWERTYQRKLTGLPEWRSPRAQVNFAGEPLTKAPPLAAPTGPAVRFTSKDWRQDLLAQLGSTGDTGPEGIAVRHAAVAVNSGGSYYADGTVWRLNGVSYLIEHDAADAGAEWVSRVLADIQRVHAETPGAPGANEAYAIVRGRNPADAYWERKYKIKGFKSAATAGDGRVTLWDFKPRAGVDRQFDRDTLRHETGHNIDHGPASAITSTGQMVGLDSGSTAWKAAARSDATTASRIGDLKASTIEARGIGVREAGKGWPDGVTEYGRSSPREDYAESYMLYTHDGPIATGRLAPGGDIVPLWFRDVFPERTKLLDQLMPDFAQRQLAEIKTARTPVVPPTREELARKTVVQLRALAREQGLTATSKLTKQGLIDALTPGEAGAGRVVVEKPVERMTVVELRALARERGLTGYSRLTKPQLLERLGPQEVQGSGGAFDTAATGRSALERVPVRAEMAGNANMDMSTWRVTGVQGLATKPPPNAISALTRYVRQPGFMNLRLTDPELIIHNQSWAELTSGVVDREAARKAGALADRYVKAIDRLMEQSRLTGDVEVWRGVELKRLAGLLADATGFTWNDPKFLSTAASRGVAEGSFGSGPAYVLLRILVPRGTGALALEGLGEQEILLERGLTYRVVADRGVTPSGARLLDVEVVPGAAPTNARTLTLDQGSGNAQ